MPRRVEMAGHERKGRRFSLRANFTGGVQRGLLVQAKPRGRAYGRPLKRAIDGNRNEPLHSRDTEVNLINAHAGEPKPHRAFPG